MIKTVEKIYLNSVWTNEYKVTFVDNTLCTVPHDENNRHYQEVLKQVNDGYMLEDNDVRQYLTIAEAD